MGRAGTSAISPQVRHSEGWKDGPARPLILPLRYADASLRGPLLLPRGEKERSTTRGVAYPTISASVKN